MALGSPKLHSGCSWQLQHIVLLIASLLTSTANGYTGFDCGQGNALLYLAGHSQCGLGSQMVCYQTLGMKVKGCQVKLWSHKGQHQARRPCWGVSLHANVTDVNHAEGTLVGPVHGSSRSPVPAVLEFTRPDESMHVRFGACVLHFEVQAASDAALQPIPGEGSLPVSSLLALLLPAVLVPCVVVSLVVAAGSVTANRTGGASTTGDGYSDIAALQYSQLPSGSSSSDSKVQSATTFPRLDLLTHNFNFKVMSRRARARRLRRSTRVVYVGPAESSVEQQLLYASGRLQPGPQNRIAPCFRFPPIAVAPALPAIPESCTPTDTSAGTPRSSSYHDMPAAAASSGYELRATAAVVPRGTSSTVTSGLPYSAGTVRGGEVVVIRRCDLALSLAPAAAHVHRQTAEQQAGQAVGKHFGSSCALVGAWFSSDAVALVGSRTL